MQYCYILSSVFKAIAYEIGFNLQLLVIRLETFSPLVHGSWSQSDCNVDIIFLLKDILWFD